MVDKCIPTRFSRVFIDLLNFGPLPRKPSVSAEPDLPDVRLIFGRNAAALAASRRRP